MIFNNKFLSMQVDISPEAFEPATKQEMASLEKMRKNVTYWQDAWRRLKENKIAMGALVVIILFVIFAVVGPMLVPYGYDQQIRGDESMFPCLKHPFGTDNLGRDLLVRVMVGTRISMGIGVGASVIVLIIGSIYGAISGLMGGKVDSVMMRIVEIIYSLPDILIIILFQLMLKPMLEGKVADESGAGIFQVLGPGIIAIFIVFGLLYWVGMARIVRAQVLSLKEMEYINAAKALGADNRRLIFKHLLPNSMGTIIVTTMLQIPAAIFTEAFLSFLGLGVNAPLASLGSLSSQALNGISSYPYLLVFPALAISIIILSFNLFGDGLRDALDPKMK